VSEHTNVDAKAEPVPANEQAIGRAASPRSGDTASLVTIANIGLVGVPLAYATSQSVLITGGRRHAGHDRGGRLHGGTPPPVKNCSGGHCTTRPARTTSLR
jgi:hypothetical protein